MKTIARLLIPGLLAMSLVLSASPANAEKPYPPPCDPNDTSCPTPPTPPSEEDCDPNHTGCEPPNDCDPNHTGCEPPNGPGPCQETSQCPDPQDPSEVIARLNKQIEALRMQIAAHVEEIATLVAQNEALRAENEALRAQVEALTARNYKIGVRWAYQRLKPCKREDSRNCRWNAQSQGNGAGNSFVDLNGTAYYLR